MMPAAVGALWSIDGLVADARKRREPAYVANREPHWAGIWHRPPCAFCGTRGDHTHIFPLWYVAATLDTRERCGVGV